MTSQADVVVVGGGLAGLSAAVHLHRAGLAVTVCEAGDEVGGRIRTDRRDGFLLDRGFHARGARFARRAEREGCLRKKEN